MSTRQLQFKPINLHAHIDQAIRFCEDAYICSFGDASRFNASEYVDWLKVRIEEDPRSGVHIWLNSQLIGQMQFGKSKIDPSVGYVNLYYLAPEFRGRGFSKSLDEHAMSYLKEKGFSKAYLSVSPSDLRAIQYYTRMGWFDRGPRPESPHVHLMEKQIP